MRTNAHRPTRKQYHKPVVTIQTPTPTPPQLPYQTSRNDTPESILRSDQATDTADTSDSTVQQGIDLNDAEEYDTSFEHPITDDDTGALEDEQSCGDLASAIAAAACDITFRSVFRPSTSNSAVSEHIDGLWGWDVTRGSYTQPRPPAEGAAGTGRRERTDKLLLPGEVMALVAEAEASAVVDARREALQQHLPAAAGATLPTLDTPAARTVGEMKHTLREAYHRLRKYERRIRRVKRKLRTYKAELKYLKSKRRRIWSLL
ncbi:hypothetical protein DFP73DRAFT_528064 [Morchella snyderi]|nr:hypothetical protein DFP73DRAFT_528064 [Morchella snyderi]